MDRKKNRIKVPIGSIGSLAVEAINTSSDEEEEENEEETKNKKLVWVV